MTKFLNGLPVYGLGRKFLIVTKKALVDNFIKAVGDDDSIVCDIYLLIAFLIFLVVHFRQFPLVNI